MELRLLGHLEWGSSDGRVVTVPGVSCRAVLAMLGLRAGGLVLTGEIIEGLWGGRLPENPDAALQVIMSRLRAAIGTDRNRLAHVRGGYQLDLDATQVDVGRARNALEVGLSLTRHGDLEAADQTLSAGLAEWRHDSPLAEFADRPFAAAAAGELTALKADLLHACNETALRLGRPQEVVDRTARMLALDPWREDLVAQQMTALRDLGRRAEALGVYTALAAGLRADFGAAPSPDLQTLEEEIRRGLGHTHGDVINLPDSTVGQPDASTRSIRAALAELVDEESDPLLRCRLELALGQAEQLAGVAGWQDTLRRAAKAADALGDREAAARCALAATFGWTLTPGRPDPKRLDDLSRAVRTSGLPEGLRARALSAYALELAFSAPVGQRLSLTDQALRTARSSGQSSLILWVLNHRFNAIWAPETLAIRQRETEEACRLAQRSGHVPAQAMAAGFAMAAAVESGDLAGVDRHLANFKAASRELDWPIFNWGVDVHSTWRAVLAGDLNKGERLARSARLQGERGARPEAGLVHTSQMAAIRWLQGRLGEELPALDAMADSVPGMRAMHAVGLLQAGRRAEAIAALDRASTSGSITSLPHDQLYLAALAQWAEVAAVADDPAAADAIYRMLLPYDRQFIFTGAAVYGPVAAPLAMLARVLDDAESARRQLNLARRQCKTMGAMHFADRLDRPAANVWRAHQIPGGKVASPLRDLGSN